VQIFIDSIEILVSEHGALVITGEAALKKAIIPLNCLFWQRRCKSIESVLASAGKKMK
jgi:hypothetical protein